MRAPIAAVVLMGVAFVAGAQDAKPQAATTNAEPVVTNTMELSAEQQIMSAPLRFDLNAPPPPAPNPLFTTNVITGPLVEPFRTRRPAQVPKRLLNLVNPFAPMETARTPHKGASRDLSARSWSSVVGWKPGQSQFVDERTHEPTMGVVVVNCSK